jgi:hypothetical protein
MSDFSVLCIVYFQKMDLLSFTHPFTGCSPPRTARFLVQKIGPSQERACLVSKDCVRLFHDTLLHYSCTSEPSKKILPKSYHLSSQIISFPSFRPERRSNSQSIRLGASTGHAWRSLMPQKHGRELVIGVVCSLSNRSRAACR